MKRILTLAVFMMLMTATYAQKQTNYQFKFEYAMDLETDKETECDVVFDISDRPGETPVFVMVNNTSGDTTREELKPTVIYAKENEMIYFSNTAGDSLYGFSINTDDNGAKSCILFVLDVENGEPKIQYGLTNETGSPNDQQCMQTYQALLKNVKADSFNNFTIESLN